MFNLNKHFSISLFILTTISTAHAEDLPTSTEDNQTNEETNEETKDGDNNETSGL